MEDAALLDLFTDMTRGHTGYVERRLLHLNLHSGQASIVSALAQRGPKTQKELAEIRQVSPATISVMVGRMARDGLVDRAPVGEGGKANQVSLTPRGEELANMLGDFMQGESEKLFARLTQADKKAALHIFGIINENLSKL